MGIHDYNPATFSRRFKAAMRERGKTVSMVSIISGINYNTLMNYAYRGHQPTAPKICAIADALDVSADYLLGRVDR